MIARMWRGWTRPEDADAYARYVDETGVSAYRSTPGNTGAWLMQRRVGDRTEILTLSFWESWDAVRAFAGDDVERAVFYPDDDRFLVDREEVVTHYELGGDPAPLQLEDLPDDVRVRPLAVADWDDVRRIYAEGIGTGHATFETQVPPLEELDAAWLPGHRWVAEVDGRVAGWAAAKPVSARAVYAGVVETSVYVGDGFRGRGVGKALLHRQVTAADEGGLWTLQTAIFPENLASVALHRAAGFRVLGVRERIGLHHGVWRDTVFMERRRASDGDVPPNTRLVP